MSERDKDNINLHLFADKETGDSCIRLTTGDMEAFFSSDFFELMINHPKVKQAQLVTEIYNE